MSDVLELFSLSWEQTTQASYTDLIRAFAAANTALHCEARPAIPTKWYEQLYAASQTVL